MKVIVQRVKNSSVSVNKKIIGSIENGLNLLVGFKHSDTKQIIDKMIDKILKLRIFEDSNKKMNLSITEVNGKILLISQFTLYANTSSGNRPSFIEAANPNKAIELYNYMLDQLNKYIQTSAGEFGSHMEVNIINDGPVTIILNSEEK